MPGGQPENAHSLRAEGFTGSLVLLGLQLTRRMQALGSGKLLAGFGWGVEGPDLAQMVEIEGDELHWASSYNLVKDLDPGTPGARQAADAGNIEAVDLEGFASDLLSLFAEVGQTLEPVPLPEGITDVRLDQVRIEGCRHNLWIRP